MVDVTVVPAQAGTHNHRLWNMGSRFRGNDGNKRRRSQSGGSRNNCAAVHKTSEQRMYNLHLSPEQLQIRDTVRDFVAEVIKPLALKPARLEARARPLLVEALDQAAQMGLRTLALSEDRGGAGADNLTCCIVTEELAAGAGAVRPADDGGAAGALLATVPHGPALSPRARRARGGSRCRARHQLSPAAGER